MMDFLWDGLTVAKAQDPLQADPRLAAPLGLQTQEAPPMPTITVFVRCRDVELRGKDVSCFELTSMPADEHKKLGMPLPQDHTAVMLRMAGHRHDAVKFHQVYRMTLEPVEEKAGS
jgi:hypothetical protein